MNKILDFIKSLGDKWKNLSSGRKVSIILISSFVLMGLIMLLIYSTRVTYDTLFTNLSQDDQANIYQKLKNDKVDVKISGSSILVPKSQVDEERMSVYSSGLVDSSQKGFELFDQSQFGLTDTQAKVMYQRALEGSLGRTIESLDDVQSAIVHLVLPDDTIFAKDTQQARASITIKMKDMATLSPDQVKAIVSMVSGSVKNLPKENVEIIDSNMHYLTDGLFDDTTTDGTMSNPKQQQYEQDFENKLQDNIKEMLQSVFGQNRVKVSVNANLNFDSTESTTITYDPKDVVLRSMQTTKNSSVDNSGNGANQSGVTSNLPGATSSYPATTSNGQSSTSDNQNNIINNEIGQSEVKSVKAPGEINSISTSVLIDGNLNDPEKNEIRNIVAAATGFNAARGDQINISALPFNKDQENQVAADLAAMKKQEEAAQRAKTYIMYGEIAGGVILLIAGLIIFGRKKKARVEETPIVDPGQSINVIVGDEVIKKQPGLYKPVLGDEEDGMTLEKEIKDYATKKPEQVVDVIRSWLSEDER